MTYADLLSSKGTIYEVTDVELPSKLRITAIGNDEKRIRLQYCIVS